MDYQRKSPLDYKDISENLRNPAWYDLENDTNLLDDAATAITDLLARAEAAEKRTEEAETENKDREGASFREHAGTHYWRDPARAAEADRDRLREALKPNCILCDSMHENGNCTEVGGFCTAVPAAHCPLIPRLRDQLTTTEARAEEAEKQRDAAIKELDAVSNAVGDLSDFIDDQIYPLVQYDMYTTIHDNVYAITTWKHESEWRCQKEE